jgi:hypothetical protein
VILDAAKALLEGEEPRSASRPQAYRVRSGGAVAPSARPVDDVLADRFGTVSGLVPTQEP